MEDKDLRYQLVTAPDPRDLSERVTVFLVDGWKLHGSPVYLNGFYGQAVTRLSPKP